MKTVLLPDGEARFELALDHSQFAVLDRRATIDIDAYTADASAIGLAQFDGGIVVFTESNWTTETRLDVRLAERRPVVESSRPKKPAWASVDQPLGDAAVIVAQDIAAPVVRHRLECHDCIVAPNRPDAKSPRRACWFVNTTAA
jgi:hypothetical protein